MFTNSLHKFGEGHEHILYLSGNAKCMLPFYLLFITSSTTSSHLCYVLLQNSPYICLHANLVPGILYFKNVEINTFFVTH